MNTHSYTLWFLKMIRKISLGLNIIYNTDIINSTFATMFKPQLIDSWKYKYITAIHRPTIFYEYLHSLITQTSHYSLWSQKLTEEPTS